MKTLQIAAVTALSAAVSLASVSVAAAKPEGKGKEEAAAAGDAPAPPAATPITDGKLQNWSDQFELIERTVDGKEHKIVRVVDKSSRVVLRRTGTAPNPLRRQDEVQRCVKQKLAEGVDASTAHNRCKAAGFRVDVWRKWRSEDSGATCREGIVVEGLTESHRDREKAAADGCPTPQKVRTTDDIVIDKGKEFIIHPDQLENGAMVEIQVYGRTLETKKVVDTKCEAATCAVKMERIPMERWTTSFRVIDFGALAIFERGHGVVSPTARVDTAHSQYVDFSSDAGWSLEDSPELRDQVVVKVSAVDGSKKTREIKTSPNGGVPTFGGLKDEEVVTVTISRRLPDGASVEINEVQFSAHALGFHYAPSGNYKADYSTASALALIMADEAEAVFAQTLTYSFSWKTREPGFADHFGFGLHFSALAGGEGPQDGDGSGTGSAGDTSKQAKPLSLGVGGQLTFGGDVLHLGGGYDIFSENPYLLFGVSLPDLVTLVEKAVGD